MQMARLWIDALALVRGHQSLVVTCRSQSSCPFMRTPPPTLSRASAQEACPQDSIDKPDGTGSACSRSNKNDVVDKVTRSRRCHIQFQSYHSLGPKALRPVLKHILEIGDIIIVVLFAEGGKSCKRRTRKGCMS